MSGAPGRTPSPSDAPPPDRERSTPKDARSEGVIRTATDGLPKDLGRGIVRVDPEDLHALRLAIGDVVLVTGEREAIGKVWPMHADRRGRGEVQLDPSLFYNARVRPGDTVQIRPVSARSAAEVRVQPCAQDPSSTDLDLLGHVADGVPTQVGDRLEVRGPNGDALTFTVNATQPDGPVMIEPSTRLLVESAPSRSKPSRQRSDSASPPHRQAAGAGQRTATPAASAYDDIGGLDAPLAQLREMTEWPLQHPGVFTRLGVDPPSGVLLSGPPGCGKTLLARAVAQENAATFFSISGPEIVRKHYGESEAELRRVFEMAEQKRPSILFIDEIDALAPDRAAVEGDVEKRIVATLLTLMDGISPRRGVVVVAATNRPDAIDPALRRAGRFDRDIAIPIPDREARREILAVHTRPMPLDGEVDLDRLADRAHGFVGADLESLCREAAMSALRRARTTPGSETADASDGLPFGDLWVTEADFARAFRDIGPSALRNRHVEIPAVRWSDVGGCDRAKHVLREAIEWPLAHAELYREARVQPPRGILLDGPPGCGKTLLAKAAATEAELNFLSVKGPEMLSKFVGESEKRVREVFRTARAAAPCLLFFDEIDAVASTRSWGTTGEDVSARVVAQLLTEMDGAEGSDGVVVLGATNRIDAIDPALLRPGRFDEVVPVGLPDEVARRSIFHVHLRNRPAQGVDLDRLAAETDGFSGADIADACRRAAMAAMRDAVRRKTERSPAPQADDAAPRSPAYGSADTAPALTITSSHVDAALDAVRARRAEMRRRAPEI